MKIIEKTKIKHRIINTRNTACIYKHNDFALFIKVSHCIIRYTLSSYKHSLQSTMSD